MGYTARIRASSKPDAYFPSSCRSRPQSMIASAVIGCERTERFVEILMR